jgi:hypothetical protein
MQPKDDGSEKNGDWQVVVPGFLREGVVVLGNFCGWGVVRVYYPGPGVAIFFFLVDRCFAERRET